MKKIAIVLITFILSGCTYVSRPTTNLDETITNIEASLNSPYDFRINNGSTYFSYYLPSDSQEMESSENAAIINYLNSKIIMNLNIPSIINNVFYTDSVFDDDGFFIKDNLIHESSGTFIKNDGSESNYFVKVYKDGESYLIQVKTNELNFYANTNMYEIEGVIKHIFLMAQSVEIDPTKIINAYSAKEVIDYQKKQVDLFEYMVPSEGYLNDLVGSSNGTVTSQETSNPVEETSEGIMEEIGDTESQDDDGSNEEDVAEESE